jgi:hypothetical protein
MPVSDQQQLFASNCMRTARFQIARAYGAKSLDTLRRHAGFVLSLSDNPSTVFVAKALVGAPVHSHVVSFVLVTALMAG